MVRFFGQEMEASRWALLLIYFSFISLYLLEFCIFWSIILNFVGHDTARYLSRLTVINCLSTSANREFIVVNYTASIHWIACILHALKHSDSILYLIISIVFADYFNCFCWCVIGGSFYWWSRRSDWSDSTKQTHAFWKRKNNH